MQATAVFTGIRSRAYPADDPLDRDLEQKFTNNIYFVAPPGSEHNYGQSPEFTVRTVAFGAIPVEATVQIEQRRENGLPVPILASSDTITYKRPPGTDPAARPPTRDTDTLIEDVITLRVTRVVVDGVDLGLRTGCETAEPGRLSLVGKAGWREFRPGEDDKKPWLYGRYTPGGGGLITGEVHVPEFARCATTTGEDVSRLITAAVSGPKNPVRLHVGAPACAVPLPPPAAGVGPPPPGASTPEASGCEAAYIPPDIPIP